MVLLLVVDDRALEVAREDVAHDAHRQVGLLEDEIGRLTVSCTRLTSTSCSLCRYLSSRSKSSRLAPCAAVLTIAPPLAEIELGRLPAQALALFVLQAPGDADALAGGGVDHVAAGDRQLHRQARALGLERVLDHLHDDLLTRLEQLGDLVLTPPRPRRAISTPGSTISSTCRNPFFSRPMSTNAASSPGRTLSTLPL